MNPPALNGAPVFDLGQVSHNIWNVQEFTEDEKKEIIFALSLQIKRSTLELYDRYFRLCSFIRLAQVEPKTVSEWLSECGFHKVAISQIKRVAFTTDEIWEDYQRRAIGFNLALERTRDEGGSKGDSAFLAWNKFTASFERLAKKEQLVTVAHEVKRGLLVTWKKGDPREIRVNGYVVTIADAETTITTHQPKTPRKKNDKSRTAAKSSRRRATVRR